MTHYISKTTEIITRRDREKFKETSNFELFLGKFEKKSDFSLNSGNLYVTLQLELCPVVS